MNDGPERPDAGWFDSIGLHALLPDSLAAWRPLVEDAMAYFLGRLPPARLEAIVLAQLELGHEASPARRLVALLAQCPTLHKLGQVLARRAGLPPELSRRLQSLESMPAAGALDPILGRLRAELGEPLPVTVADAVLAEGSVAVVLPFRYLQGGSWRDGVFKVLRPGVEARLAEELAVLPGLAAFIAARAAELGLPTLDFVETVSSVRRLLTRELRLDAEQANMRAARAFYADEPRVLVPEVLPWSTPRVTAMERVFGAKLTDAHLSASQRCDMAETVVGALLAKPFWTRSDPAVFHGDLHGGNLLISEDGRLAVLDWSLVARVPKAEREALLAIALGALTFDAGAVRGAIASLGIGAADDVALGAVVERALDRLVAQGRVPGFDWMVALLDELMLGGGAQPGEDLGLFRKSWLSLSGVVRDLAGAVAPDLPLVAAGARAFLAEWPQRWLGPPFARDYATHVSNADLCGLAASAWFAPLRYASRLQAIGLQAFSAPVR